MTILSGELADPNLPTLEQAPEILESLEMTGLRRTAETLTLDQIPMRGWAAMIKRAMDIVLSALLLIMNSPLMLLIAIAIKLESGKLGSGGPVIFRQPRVGRGGRTFTILKFRTMAHANCPRKIDELSLDDHKPRNDVRVTPLGRFLRAYSLDELPQLFNVLIGDMSLVGPRPEVLWVFDWHYDRWQRARVLVPPGITGWWQVNGRSDRPLHENTEDDIYYIVNWSLLLDLKILLRTFAAVIHRRGAF
jgi:lipopolysaccharide/colanic/teichoic acid biosynthesis glycosyltransferase